MRSTWMLLGYLPLLVWAVVSAQDDSWGVKVKCYMVDGTAVCPECNSRAGLSCPRFDDDMDRKCDVTSPPRTMEQTPVLEEKDKTDCDEPKTDSKTPDVTTQTEAGTTETEISMTGTSSPVSETPTPADDLPSLVGRQDFQQVMKDNIDMQIFLYRVLRPMNRKRRMKRETPNDLEEGTCRWNGDCPCPQICCRAGEGCPRRCKMGIRLPPPWGKR